MPRHLAIDVNVVSGSIHLENTKTAEVQFRDSSGNPVVFSLAPRISMTLLFETSVPIYKFSNVKTGSVYTGFRVGFQIKVTGDIEWVAQERA